MHQSDSNIAISKECRKESGCDLSETASKNYMKVLEFCLRPFLLKQIVASVHVERELNQEAVMKT